MNIKTPVVLAGFCFFLLMFGTVWHSPIEDAYPFLIGDQFAKNICEVMSQSNTAY